LPDFHVYNKGDLRLPVADRKTKLYTVMNMYGREFDQNKLENFLTTTNNYLDLCRDEQLFQNFGNYFSYQKPTSQEAVEYRECLRSLVLGSLVGSTVSAVQSVIRCFTGIDPEIVLIRTLNDFFLSTIHETPTPTPDGFTTTFFVTYVFTAGSLIVLKNGIVQTSGVDYTENQSLPGFQMTVAPAPGDSLLVFYNIGAVNDPIPLVFDIADTTPLTGTVTFTNGSAIVTGAGTLFTSELIPGDEITDSQGLYLGVVSTIANDLSLTLAQAWIGSTNTGSAKKLNYTTSQIPPSTLWDRASLAHGVIIRILNPGLFTLDQELIEVLVKPLLPSHVKVFFEFV
jgi:hypothetical protein